MPDITRLKICTEKFFSLHWDKRSNIPPPSWSNPWYFFGEVPNNSHKGCYAWLKNNEVIYIGVAINRGQKGYEGHSLGTRIKKYWKFTGHNNIVSGERYYEATEELKFHNIDSITILPFPFDEQEYLAASLEIYLIGKLQPEANKFYK